ncbi:MAG: MBL fold metallo-hydrolase [Chlorobi bacterium]|nr:MBL fold metallo-hydrolase [Chlorobiota bacterium]
MKLSVLTENTAGGRFGAEHGLSYLIEHDNKTILFDTGHSDLFLKNAEKFGYNLKNDVDAIVLSHGHWDHGDGLRFISDKPLITHPSAFIKRYRKADHSYIGLAITKEEAQNKFGLTTSAGPNKITDKIIFLGAIPRENDFEAKSTTFVDEDGNEDFVPDDSAMVFILDDEIVVVTACSHSGICNITEYARKITGISKVKVVIGGFHLKKNDNQTRETVTYFKKLAVEQLYPSHCTELPALAVFYEEFGIEQVKTGKQYTF